MVKNSNFCSKIQIFESILNSVVSDIRPVRIANRLDFLPIEKLGSDASANVRRSKYEIKKGNLIHDVHGLSAKFEFMTLHLVEKKDIDDVQAEL